jgi:UDP-N-acetylglucosamine acyltransferase
MIDSSARIETGAVIGDGVSIGPFCTIGPNVTIGDGCKLSSHVNITGHTTIGPRTSVQPFTSLGTPPQSKRYRGGPTRLIVGTDCDIREGVTMNTGTEDDRGVTEVAAISWRTRTWRTTAKSAMMSSSVTMPASPVMS